MANTFWSTTNKSSNVTLSGSDLIASNTNTSGGYVHSDQYYSTGKYYFEITINTAGNSNAGYGVAVSSEAAYNANGPATGIVSFVNFGSGLIYKNRASTGISLGATLTNGDVLGIAIDFDNAKIWLRKNTGNWNNNGSNDPATNTGGISFTGSPSFSPYLNTGTTAAEQTTANFGNSAFTGTVPSGFTSGWPLPQLGVDVDTGSFTFTGNVETLTYNHKLDIPSGSFTFTGNNETLTHSYPVSVDSGVFNLTGNAETLAYNYKLDVASGSFAFTGNELVISPFKLDISLGSFTFTGNVETLTYNHKLDIPSGSFTFTGNNETLTYNHKLGISSGSFIFTGSNIDARKVFNILINTGSFTFTTSNQEFKFDHKFQITTQTYSNIFNSTTLIWTRFYAQDTGTAVFTGNSINFTRNYDNQLFAPSYHTIFNNLNIARSRALQLTGNYNFTGSNLSLDSEHKLTTNVTYSSNITSNLQINRKLNLATGTIIINGSQIIAQNFDLLVVNSGNFSYSGSDLNLAIERKIQTTGNFYFVGFDQELIWSGGIVYPQDNPWSIVISDELDDPGVGSDSYSIIANGGDYEVVHN